MSRFIAIDFETACHAPESACALGLIEAEDGRIVDRQRYLIRPPEAIFTNSHIHGMTWEDVREAPDFASLWVDIAGRFSGVDFIAAHNARFDGTVLASLCRSYCLAMPDAPFVCTVEVARKTWGLRPTGLKHCARFLCVQLDHHEPLSDANACAEIVLAAEIDGWRPSVKVSTNAR